MTNANLQQPPEQTTTAADRARGDTPKAADTRTPLIEMQAVDKHFGNVVALSNISLRVYAGEVMCLLGDNGAGKSTLIKGIVGIYPFDEGQVEFEGKPVKIHGPRDAAALGIEVVYQDLALADNLDVVANIITGRAADIEYVDMRYSNGFTIGWNNGSRTPVDDTEDGVDEMLALRGEG